MGFFTDLKEDLSQAVNELMPEEESMDMPEEAAQEWAAEEEYTAEEETIEASPEDEIVEEDIVAADVQADPLSFDGFPVDIDEMLNKVEEMDMMSEESVYVAAAEAEMIKTDKTSREVSDETATITVGMKIMGDITSEGSLELEGTVNGNIDILGKLNVTGNVTGNSQAAEIYADNAKINGEVRSMGSVKIGQSSVIIGNIFANSAVIAGAVKGDIDVQGPVILDTSAIVMGNIKSKSVQINNGAVIEGMCSQCYADVNPTSFFDEFKKSKK